MLCWKLLLVLAVLLMSAPVLARSPGQLRLEHRGAQLEVELRLPIVAWQELDRERLGAVEAQEFAEWSGPLLPLLLEELTFTSEEGQGGQLRRAELHLDAESSVLLQLSLNWPQSPRTLVISWARAEEWPLRGQIMSAASGSSRGQRPRGVERAFLLGPRASSYIYSAAPVRPTGSFTPAAAGQGPSAVSPAARVSQVVPAAELRSDSQDRGSPSQQTGYALLLLGAVFLGIYLAP